MLRTIRNLLLAAAPLAMLGAAPNVADAGHWQEHNGHQYYWDDGHWHWQNNGTWYRYNNGWQPYTAWNSGYSNYGNNYGRYGYGYNGYNRGYYGNNYYGNNWRNRYYGGDRVDVYTPGGFGYSHREFGNRDYNSVSTPFGNFRWRD